MGVIDENDKKLSNDKGVCELFKCRQCLGNIAQCIWQVTHLGTFKDECWAGLTRPWVAFSKIENGLCFKELGSVKNSITPVYRVL